MDPTRMTSGAIGLVLMGGFGAGFFKAFILEIPVVITAFTITLIIGIILALLSRITRPISLVVMVFLAPALAAIAFGIGYSLAWYFTDYLPGTGEPLIRIGSHYVNQILG